mmetsp:Transcript_27347/g.57523  ORF Transcript_27347/g.57523 Transcript_27347/m.57523 type:complete len:227 (-) Transcript_27347:453-1133(-)
MPRGARVRPCRPQAHLPLHRRLVRLGGRFRPLRSQGTRAAAARAPRPDRHAPAALGRPPRLAPPLDRVSRRAAIRAQAGGAHRRPLPADGAGLPLVCERHRLLVVAPRLLHAQARKARLLASLQRLRRCLVEQPRRADCLRRRSGPAPEHGAAAVERSALLRRHPHRCLLVARSQTDAAELGESAAVCAPWPKGTHTPRRQLRRRVHRELPQHTSGTANERSVPPA